MRLELGLDIAETLARLRRVVLLLELGVEQLDEVLLVDLVGAVLMLEELADRAHFLVLKHDALHFQPFLQLLS